MIPNLSPSTWLAFNFARTLAERARDHAFEFNFLGVQIRTHLSALKSTRRKTAYSFSRD